MADRVADRLRRHPVQRLLDPRRETRQIADHVRGERVAVGVLDPRPEGLREAELLETGRQQPGEDGSDFADRGEKPLACVDKARVRRPAVGAALGSGGVEEPERADHRLGRGVVDLMGDPAALLVLRPHRLASEAVDEPAIVLELAALALGCPVELVELLARGDHLGKGLGRRSAPISAARPLVDLPRAIPIRVAQDPGCRQRGAAARRLGLARGPAQRSRGDADLLGDGDRRVDGGRSDAQDRDPVARASRRGKGEEADTRGAVARDGASVMQGPVGNIGGAGTTEGKPEIGRADGGAERRAILPAGKEPGGRRAGGALPELGAEELAVGEVVEHRGRV